MFEVGAALGFLEATALIEGGVTGFGLFFFWAHLGGGLFSRYPLYKSFRTVALVLYHKCKRLAVNLA